MKSIYFRLANSSDFERIYKWCQKDFVYEWFEQRKLSFEEICKKYDKKIDHSNQIVCIIEYGDIPIGLLQYYPYLENKDDSSNVYEYDIFIGEEEYLSKGIGSLVISSINDFLFNDLKVEKIVLRPMKKNIRACRCYEKCGFIKVCEYEDTDTVGNKEVFVLYEKEKK